MKISLNKLCSLIRLEISAKVVAMEIAVAAQAKVCLSVLEGKVNLKDISHLN
jgi:hypothetical protein